MFSSQKMFSSPSLFGEDDVAYHSISTNNKYMVELGLGVFTTGQLYRWMSQTNRNGEFFNLALLQNVDGSMPKNSDNPSTIKQKAIAFGPKILTPEFNSVKFYPWRNKDLTGDYEETGYLNWSCKDFNYGDLEFGSFFHKSISLIKIGTDYVVNKAPTTNLDVTICSFIEMNNLARILPMVKSKAEYTKQENAVHEFILDVKTSQTKSIKWTSRIDFLLNTNPRCPVSTDVEFELHLYDSYLSRNSNRTVAFNGLKVASNMTNEFGRLDKKDGSGEHEVQNLNNDPKDSVAGNLALTYVPAKGEFTSGTQQVIGILLDDVPAAIWPSLDVIKNNPISSKEPNGILNSTQGIKPGTGFAIPISSQNGNPLQWAPQYKNEKGCRDPSDYEKFKISVQNLSTTRAFNKGEQVLLSEINGFWTISPLGEPKPEDLITDGTPKQWNFTYLLMNYDNFFRINFFGTKYNTIGYEEAVYNYYYDKPDGNQNIVGSRDRAVQVTSWDFMGHKIGGLRQKNALSCTIFNRKPNGDLWPDYENGAYSTPFFGCVFPDGYDEATKYRSYKTPNGHSTFKVRQITDYVTPTPFFTQVDTGVNIFDNNNDNANPDGNNVGMFYLSSVNSLANLPADIALNASPEGVNGSPVINNAYTLYLDKDYESNVTAGSSYQAQVAQYFEKANVDAQPSRYAWLHAEGSGNLNSSMFDFKPINSAKIQFRPLKIEVYAAMLGKAFPSGDRFATTARSFIIDNNLPAHTGVITRNIFGTSMVEDNFRLRYNANLLERGFPLPGENQNARFPRPHWSLRDFQSEPFKPAGAFGVIAASCVVKANSKIMFSTENVIGMRSWFSAAGGARPWYASLGGFGDNYDSLQNTQLYARIFHKWPKEQTLFDPQTFSVFHFNPGINNDNLSDTYSVDYETYGPGDNFRTGDRVAKGGVIFSSITIPLVVTKDISRRGMMLPYEYTRESNIGFALDKVYIEGGSYSAPPTPMNFNIYIKNMGSGYLPTDTFVVSGGNGVSPTLNPFVVNGQVAGFTSLNDDYGYGYKPENFLDLNQKANETSQGLNIVPLSVNGTGFAGKFIAGAYADSPLLIDEKPKSVGDPFIQLTPNINTQAGANGSSSIIEEFTGSVQKSIPITTPSPDKSYDIFFHFHNDASHTFVSQYAGAAGGPVAPLENHVTLSITTL